MTYLDSVFEAFAADPGNVVVVDGDTGAQTTAAEFTGRVARVAHGLQKMVSARDVVALVAPVALDALVTRYAAGLLGCATVFCPYAHSPQRLSQFLAQIGPDLTIVFPETAAAISGPGFVSFGSLLGTDSTGSVPLPHADVASTDLCVLVATGGTTGISKVSTRDWGSYAALVQGGPTPGRRQLICTPMAYVAQTVADSVLIGGGMLVLHRTFEPTRILRTVAEHRVTHAALVEPLLVALLDSPELVTSDLRTLQTISHVGADAAASLRARLLTRIGRPILVQPYGTSECGVASVLAPPDYSLEHPDLLATSGRPHAAVRIVDGNDNDCAKGELGEILVRSPAAAQGYAGGPPTSGFRDDGWFATQDMGTLDANGYLRIRGRAADMRVIGGHAVFPADLQQAFCALPGVRYAVAIPGGGDSFGVALVAGPDVTTVADLVASVREHGGDHLVPAAVAVIPTMPVTEQGKPDRRALAQVIWGDG